MKMMINTFFLQKGDDAAAEDFALLGFWYSWVWYRIGSWVLCGGGNVEVVVRVWSLGDSILELSLLLSFLLLLLLLLL
jgi:hypothetical protein